MDTPKIHAVAWDRLIDLLAEDTPTDQQVEVDLKAAGIDMRPAYERLRKMIEARGKHE